MCDFDNATRGKQYRMQSAVNIHCSSCDAIVTKRNQVDLVRYRDHETIAGEYGAVLEYVTPKHCTCGETIFLRFIACAAEGYGSYDKTLKRGLEELYPKPVVPHAQGDSIGRAIDTIVSLVLLLIVAAVIVAVSGG